MDNLRHFSILRTYRGRINPASQIRTHAECVCVCGNVFHANYYDIKIGKTKSCGCITTRGQSATTHGRTGTKEWRAWAAIRNRCNNPRTPAYKDYGARGIKVCDRWEESFENFIEDMGLSPTAKHSIERKENDKGYSPDNCYWATSKEQCNNRRTSRIIEFNGERKTLMQWAEHTGMHWSTIRSRIERSKWSIEKALTQPI